MNKVLCTLILWLAFAGLPAQAQDEEKMLYELLHGWVCSSEELAVRFAQMRNDGKTEVDAATAINTDKKTKGRCNIVSFYAQPPVETIGTTGGVRYMLRSYEVIGTVRGDLTMVRHRRPIIFFTCKFIHTDKG